MRLPSLRIGDIEVEIPIVQGGMGVGISLSSLASAVAKEGGVGVISAAEIGMLDPDFASHPRRSNAEYLRMEIRKAKELTDGVIGVNLMTVLSDYDDLLRICVEESVDIIFAGAGLPLSSIESSAPGVVNKHTKFVPIVSSGRAASVIFRYWEKHYGKIPDGVVVEGPMAGGHLGFKREQIYNPDYSLEKIFPEVLKVIRTYEEKFDKEIPVIPAGGIYTGEDIYKFMKMGASGVQMATRFVATHECDASEAFKQEYIRARKEDIEIIQSPVGLPGRAIRNDFLERVNRGETKPFSCVWYCMRGCNYRKAPYCIAYALINAQKGNLREGFAFAGENVYRVNNIVSVKELINELEVSYLSAYEKDLRA